MVSSTRVVRSGRSLGAKLLAGVALLGSALTMQVATPSPAGAYPLGQGFWLAGEDGGVFAFGEAQYFGSAGGIRLARPVVGIASVPFYEGYWLAGEDGGIFSYGSAGFYGSVPQALGPNRRLEEPIFNIAADPSGLGYYLVAADGGVFAFGAAGYFGATTEPSIPDAQAPMTDIDPTPSGNGYWTVAADGSVFSFGDAQFFGSMMQPGGPRASAAILGIESTPSGNGYWLVGLDGAVYAFGDAGFYGSMTEPGRPRLAGPVVGIARTQTGMGYRLTSTDGGVYNFGDAIHYGSATGLDLKAPIVGIDTRPPFSVKVDAFPSDANSTSFWTSGADPALSLTQTAAPTANDAPAGARILGVEGINVGQLEEIGFTLESGACAQQGDVRFVLSARNGAGTNFVRTYGCTAGAAPGTAFLFDPSTAEDDAGQPFLADSLVVNSLDIIFDGGPTPGGGSTVTLDDFRVSSLTVGDTRVVSMQA